MPPTGEEGQCLGRGAYRHRIPALLVQPYRTSCKARTGIVLTRETGQKRFRKLSSYYP